MILESSGCSGHKAGLKSIGLRRARWRGRSPRLPPEIAGPQAACFSSRVSSANDRMLAGRTDNAWRLERDVEGFEARCDLALQPHKHPHVARPLLAVDPTCRQCVAPCDYFGREVEQRVGYPSQSLPSGVADQLCRRIDLVVGLLRHEQ